MKTTLVSELRPLTMEEMEEMEEMEVMDPYVRSERTGMFCAFEVNNHRRSLGLLAFFLAMFVTLVGFNSLTTGRTHNVDYSQEPVWIATASSDNHYEQLRRFLCDLQPIRDEMPHLRIRVADVGLNERQRALLSDLHRRNFIDEFSVMDFALHPPWWDIKVAVGEYAFKIQALWDTVKIAGVEAKRAGFGSYHVVWLDAGDSFDRAGLDAIVAATKKTGFTSDETDGPASKWTYPAMADYFQEHEPQWDMSDWKNITMCNGAINAYSLPTALPLIEAQMVCAQNRECIAPQGSSRDNHRQDQSALTMLSYYMGYGNCGAPYPSFNLHQDYNPNMGSEMYKSGVCAWELQDTYKRPS